MNNSGKDQNGSKPDPLAFLKDIARDPTLRRQPIIQKLLNRLIRAGDNPRALLQTAKWMRRQMTRRFDVQPQAPSEIIPVGIDEQTGETLGPDWNSIPRHFLGVGGTGSGKTVMLFQMVLGLIQLRQKLSRSLPIFALDMKRELRRLARTSPVLVFPRGTFKWNPLVPPTGVALEQWISEFSQAFSEAFELRLPSKMLLERETFQLFEDYRTASTGIYPSVLDLDARIRSRIEDKGTASSEKSKYLVLLNRTDALVRKLGDTLDCSRGFPLDELISEDLVLELDGIGGAENKRWMSMLLLWSVYNHFLAKNLRGGTPRLAIFADEAAHIFKGSSQKDMSIQDGLLTMGRDMGLCFFVFAQQPSILNKALLGNISTVVCKALSNIDDLRWAKSVLGLSDEMVRLLPSLPVTNAFYRENTPEPRTIDVAGLPEGMEHVGNEEVLQIMKPHFDRLNRLVVERVPFETIQKPKTGALTSEVGANPPKPISPLAELEAFLTFIARNPGLGIVEISDGLDIGRNKAMALKQRCLENGLIRKNSERKSRGRPVLKLTLTEKGRKQLPEGVEPTLPGRGGRTHREVQHAIAKHFRSQGCLALVESDIGGKAIDVVIRDSEKRLLGVEVHLTKDRESLLKQIKADLLVGLDGLWVVLPEGNLKSFESFLRAELNEKDISRVQFHSVEEYIPGEKR